jgi:amino acid adenylation domain-containing protein
MTAEQLIADLCRAGVELWRDGERLRYRAREGAMTGPLRAALEQRKGDVLALLRQGDGSDASLLPPSPGQRGLWFLHRLAPQSAAYTVTFIARIDSAVDPGALRRSFAALVERHTVLRTTFQVFGGEPVQQVHERWPLHFEEMRITAGGDGDLAAQALAASRRPFDLRRESPLRVFLLTRHERQHVLVVAVHHLAFDLQSLWVFIDELRAIHGAGDAGAGGPVRTPPPGPQFQEFVRWQADLLAGPEGERQRQFWQRHLGAELPTIEVPADRPRPAVPSLRGATVELRLAAPLATALRALARRRGATLYMVLLASFAALLYRHTQQQEQLVATPFSGRTSAVFSRTMGYLTNLLLLRLTLRPAMSYGDLVQAVRELVVAALEHQDYPCVALLESLGLKRQAGIASPFQVEFALQKMIGGDLPGSLGDGETEARVTLGGLVLHPLVLPQQEGQADLMLEVLQGEGALHCFFKYSTDLFDPGTVQRLADRFERLLLSHAASPELALDSAVLLSGAELHQLLAEWNPAAPAAAVEGTLHEGFERWAARAPAAVAVTLGGRAVTYGELDRMANRTARQLLEAGVAVETRVGLCAERSLELVVGILAVLKAGGAYVPLDPAYPRERLALMLEQAAVPVVLVQEHLAACLPEHRARTVWLQAEAAGLERWQEDPRAGVDAANAAYVLYTSGSTGVPKGVVVTHANVLRLFYATEPWFGFDREDVWPLFHSYAFDLSVWEMFGAFLYGGRLVVVPEEVSRSPRDFHSLVVAEHATVLTQTPTAFRQFQQAAAAAAADERDRLRLVIFGGEALEPESVREWMRRRGDAQPRLINMYGITETTVHVSYRPLARAEMARGEMSAIGGPIPDLEMHLLDGELQLVPVGVPGEIHVGGAGLARGYLGRPELTAQRFVPHPWPRTAGERLYRSGDLARRRADGDIEYLGRIDQQVKIRGFRIELGDVEDALSGHPAVAECAVAAQRETAGAVRLVAYVVAAEASLTVAALREFLGERLPEHMLPSVFVLTAALPRTPSGKLDRRALPALQAPSLDLGTPYVAPGSDAERALSEVWRQVLQVERVGVDDGFFALGGDSVRSIQVMALAEARGWRFTLPQLFELQTVRRLAAILEPAAAAAVVAAPASRPFQLVREADRARLPAGIEDAYPLARLQMGLLFHGELDAGAAFYHDIFGYRLRGELSPAALGAALAELIHRHPVLRTSFDLESFSEPLQLVHAAVAAPLTVIDLRRHGAGSQRRQLAAALAQEKLHGFDRRRAPQLRLLVYWLETDVFQLTLSFHHAILDGWSVASLLAELMQLYAVRLGNVAAAPRPAPVSLFRDFVALEQEALGAAESRRFWAASMAGADFTALPRCAAGPAAPVRPRRAVRVETVPIVAAVAAGLQSLASARGVPLKSVLLAAHLRVLSLLGGHGEVVTGLVVNGRLEEADGERALGLFLNTVPLRAAIAGGPWQELAAQVFALELALLPHRRFPLAEVQRDLGGSPLFETAFNYNHFHVYDTVRSLPQFAFLGGDFFEATNFVLLASFERDLLSDGIGLQLRYDVSQLRAEQVRAWAGYYSRCLAAIAERPDGRCDLAVLLSGAELHQLLVEWNPAAPAAAVEGTLHEGFERWAARAPAAVAVTLGGRAVTYGELDRMANRTARQLLEAGVAVETRVGLCAERSLELVVGILAVLKAGGAYVPLDPAYPRERLALMLEQAAVPVVLVQEHLAACLPEHRARTVWLQAEAAGLERWQEDPRAGVDAANAAYVLYTSGSTGVPKGVVVTHANVLRLFYATEPWFGFDREDVWPLFHSYAFDLSVWEMFGAFLYGGRLVVVPEEVSRSPRDFHSLVVAEHATVLTQTPTAFRQFQQAAAAAAADERDRLRLVIFGGEALEPESVREWMRRRGDAQPRLINMYGITETTVHVSYRPLARAEMARGEMSAIGGPIPDLEMHLLDGELQLVPVGVPGEIHVGGAGLARGYLGRPELTAQRFVPHPWPRTAGERLYRSGDLARRRADGDIEYLGRIDQQVKIRGFRIELGDVEDALSGHPAVAECAVAAQRETAGAVRLVAYVVAAEASLTVAALREFLGERLPEHMLPSVFVLTAALPRTPSGKLDRRALPALQAPSLDLGTPYVAPGSDAERALSEVWRQVLQVERVGVDDGFFALGGDSVRSIQVMALAEARGWRFTLPQLFELQTVRRLAAILEPAAAAVAAAPASRPFQLVREADRARLPAGIEDAYPLARLQLGLLFHGELDAGAAIYHDIFSYRLRGELSPAALGAALAEVIRRHPVLRTSFDLESFSEPLQLVHAAVAAPLTVIDLRRRGAGVRRRQLAAALAQEKLRGFDRHRAPQLRLLVYWLETDVFQLTLSFHHAILDGWSVASLLTELMQLYAVRLGNVAAAPRPAPVSLFRDFVAREQETLSATETRRFWAASMAGAEVTALPRRAGGGRRRAVSVEPVPIAGSVAAGLRSLAHEGGVPLKSVLLAAHLRVLSLLGGRSDVVTGLVVNGRLEEADGERALGLFLNTVPLRAALAGGTWRELVAQVFARELALLAHRRFPLAEMQRELGRGPLFETVFNYTDFHVYDAARHLPRLSFLDGEIFEETNFLLAASFTRGLAAGEGSELRLSYDASQLGIEQVRAWAGHYSRCLATLAAQPDRRYEAAALLSAAERHQLLIEWNDTAAAAPGDAVLHRLFEAQVERDPASIAVVFDDRSLTYGELNTWANRLARRLADAGVGPEVRVGLCIERSLEMVVGVLGILKAGGAYVPMDPTYPRRRLRLMARDAAVAMVVGGAGWTAEALGLAGGPAIDVAAERPMAAETWGNLGVPVSPQNLAYVIYTSGSTGEPKGVAITHAATINFLRAMSDTTGLGATDTVLALASISFDMAVGDLFLPLLAGARLAVARGELAADGRALAAALTRTRATLMQATPTTWRLLLDSGDWPAVPLGVISAGEALAADLAAQLAARARRVWNAYGPTEAAVGSSVHDLTAAPPPAAASPAPAVPLGRPLRQVSIYLLDRALAPAPVGVAAELCIGGVGLARGYLGRPDLTAERFIPDPHGPLPGRRLYKTGDLARFRSDGKIEFLGRVDHQVKIRGFRIELAEIEAVLRRHPEVTESVVVARERGIGDSYLVCYFTYRRQAPAPDQLVELLQATLPEHMIPAHFVPMRELPRTPSGKLDRRALPRPGPDRPQLGDALVPPRGATQEQLAAIWSEELCLAEVGARDNFFALGGTSLTAVRVRARMEAIFGVQVPLAALMEKPTIEQMARMVERRAGWGRMGSLVEIQAGTKRPPLFFVHAANGHVLGYAALARELGPAQPFYGLQALGLEAGARPHRDIRSMAAAYVAEIRQVQEQGPYRLAGWSMGASVAFEMAAQLIADNERVDFLGLVDAVAPSAAPGAALGAMELLATFARGLGLPGELLEQTWGTGDVPLEQGQRQLVAWLGQRDSPFGDIGFDEMGRLYEVFRNNLRAMGKYRPPRYPGRVHLFLCDDGNGSRLQDPSQGWGALAADGVAVFRSPGDHFSMLSPPHVRVLACCLAGCLANASSRSPQLVAQQRHI